MFAFVSTEASRQEFIADGEAMSQAEAGAERALHVAHESVGGMFTGEMEPVQITSFPERAPSGNFGGRRKIVGSLGEKFAGPIHKFGRGDLALDSGIDTPELF